MGLLDNLCEDGYIRGYICEFASHFPSCSMEITGLWLNQFKIIHTVL